MGSESGPIPSMVPLSTDNVDFINDLEKLDRQSTRTAETVYIFYMKNGQKHPDEILRNVVKSDHVNRVFLDFLASLGWPVNVWHHTGWTGRLSTSWRSQHEPMVLTYLKIPTRFWWFFKFHKNSKKNLPSELFS